MEIVVDAYTPEERALSWYYYLEEHLGFPFTAECVQEMSQSPLKKHERVEVVGMPDEDACESDMLVLISLLDRTFAVPLTQLRPLKADAETKQAIADWHYWKSQGYLFY